MTVIVWEWWDMLRDSVVLRELLTIDQGEDFGLHL